MNVGAESPASRGGPGRPSRSAGARSVSEKVLAWGSDQTSYRIQKLTALCAAVTSATAVTNTHVRRSAFASV